MIRISGWACRYPLTPVPPDGPAADPAAAMNASHPRSGRLPAAGQFADCDRGR